MPAAPRAPGAAAAVRQKEEHMAAWPTHVRPQVLQLFDLLGQCDDARLGAELLGEAQLSSAA
eukprot:8941872-Pyramimonas_sp.AAC.1